MRGMTQAVHESDKLMKNSFKRVLQVQEAQRIQHNQRLQQQQREQLQEQQPQ